MFEFTTLSSSGISTINQARILSFDNQITILADPGWDGLSDLSYLDPIIPKVDLIILSQTTIEYLGAFAFLLHKYPLLRQIKTYATLPIAKLGRLSTFELYRSIGLIGPVEDSIFDSTDIEKFFNSIITINYLQTIPLQGKLSGISITAYNSGHTLGGSIWSFTKDTEKIIYAPAWNHSKDLFLNPCRFGNQSNLLRPTTLITGTDLGSNFNHRKRIEKFLQIIDLTILNGTSVLLPTSITGRFFELLTLLDQKLPNDVPFYLVSYTGIQSLQFSSNMLEWMAPDITKNWEKQNQNQTIFDSTRIQLIRIEELKNLDHSSPKIIFVENLDFIEGSLSRNCFIDLCSKQNMALILTERPNDKTEMFEIYDSWEKSVTKNSNLEDGSLIIFEKNFNLNIINEEPLRGKDLKTYLKKVEERREKERLLEVEERKNDDILDEMIGDDENDNDDENESEELDLELELDRINNENEDENGDNDKLNDKKTTIEKIEDNDHDENGNLTTSAFAKRFYNHKSDENIKISLNEIISLPMDFDIRHLKGKNKMFPYLYNKVSTDDYGIIINHDDFIREEEKFPINKPDGDEDLEEYEDYDEEDELIGYDSNDEDDFEDNSGKRKRKSVNKSRKRQQRRRIKKKSAIQLSNLKTNKSSLYNLESTVDPITRSKKSVSVSIRCGLTFIDLSGLCDLRSLKFNSNLIKPRKVILLPTITRSSYLGDSLTIMESLLKQQTKDLKNFTNNELTTGLGTDYLNCKLNETINLGNVITSYNLSIDESLDKELKWQVITDGYSLSHITGEIIKIKKEDDNNKFNYKLIPSNKQIKNDNSSISIGDVKLNQLRKILSDENHSVEFTGDGTLVVDNQLAVRKISDGNLIIDGLTSKLFYDVKNVIARMLANL